MTIPGITQTSTPYPHRDLRIGAGYWSGITFSEMNWLLVDMSLLYEQKQEWTPPVHAVLDDVRLSAIVTGRVRW